MKKMYYFINLFFITSMLGYLLEQGIMLLIGKTYNSSLLHGPWTIVYGIASLLILLCGDKISKINIKKYLRVILFLITSFIILSLLEFIAGISIEKLLGIVYWDYTSMPLHLGKYVCVPVSLIWTTYACLLNYLFYPKLKKLAKKIPSIITILVLLLFIIDIAYTIYEYFYYLRQIPIHNK